MLTQNIRLKAGVMALEWIIIATILVIGLGIGLALFRNVLIVEYGQTASSVAHLRPEFSYPVVGAADPSNNENYFYAGKSSAATWQKIQGRDVPVSSVSSTPVAPTSFSLEASN